MVMVTPPMAKRQSSGRRGCFSAKGHDTGLEADEVGPLSSFPCLRERSYDGEEYTYTLEIQDEFDLDGEVGKRINQLSVVPVHPEGKWLLQSSYQGGPIKPIGEESPGMLAFNSQLKAFDKAWCSYPLYFVMCKDHWKIK